jgi:glycosyltransferase involved in cell wall biosynthesis
VKINYILSHPIQYQVPLIRYLSKNKINILVSYRSNISVKKFYDPGFKKNIKWNVDLLKGYNFKFLKFIGPNKVNSIFPLTTDVFNILRDKGINVVWLHGCKNWFNLVIIFLNIFFKKKIFLRDETNHFSRNRNLLNKIFNLIFYILINNFVDVFLAIGKANKQYYIDNNISKKKIVNVPYVVDNDFFKNKQNLKNNKKIKFLFVAKLQFKKGIDLLLEVILNNKNNKDFLNYGEFSIVGSGEFEKYCKDFIQKNNLKNVRLFNFQNQKQLRSFYNKSDVLILPSRREPWGLVINEAMAAGNAIIASDKVGSAADLVIDNYNGKVFQSGNVQDLEKKISYFIKNRSKINFFKKNSLKKIEQFSFKQCLIGINKALSIAKRNIC